MAFAPAVQLLFSGVVVQHHAGRLLGGVEGHGVAEHQVTGVVDGLLLRAGVVHVAYEGGRVFVRVGGVQDAADHEAVAHHLLGEAGQPGLLHLQGARTQLADDHLACGLFGGVHDPQTCTGDR